MSRERSKLIPQSFPLAHILFMPCRRNVGCRPVIDSRFSSRSRPAGYRRAADARPTANQRLFHVENLSLAARNRGPQYSLRSQPAIHRQIWLRYYY